MSALGTGIKLDRSVESSQRWERGCAGSALPGHLRVDSPFRIAQLRFWEIGGNQRRKLQQTMVRIPIPRPTEMALNP
jgi:hypothetical protein